jgi:hypothetical protein
VLSRLPTRANAVLKRGAGFGSEVRAIRRRDATIDGHARAGFRARGRSSTAAAMRAWMRSQMRTGVRTRDRTPAAQVRTRVRTLLQQRAVSDVRTRCVLAREHRGATEKFVRNLMKIL